MTIIIISLKRLHNEQNMVSTVTIKHILKGNNSVNFLCVLDIHWLGTVALYCRRVSLTLTKYSTEKSCDFQKNNVTPISYLSKFLITNMTLHHCQGYSSLFSTILYQLWYIFSHSLNLSVIQSTCTLPCSQGKPKNCC